MDTLGLIIWGILGLMGVVLSVNLKWVAYLNFKQKWKSILLIILIGLYIAYFLTILDGFGEEYEFVPYFDIHNLITFKTLNIFTLAYCLFSVLVILFNLPTSSGI